MSQSKVVDLRAELSERAREARRLRDGSAPYFELMEASHAAIDVQIAQVDAKLDGLAGEAVRAVTAQLSPWIRNECRRHARWWAIALLVAAGAGAIVGWIGRGAEAGTVLVRAGLETCHIERGREVCWIPVWKE